jgi:hypothetical protein
MQAQSWGVGQWAQLGTRHFILWLYIHRLMSMQIPASPSGHTLRRLAQGPNLKV